MPPKVQKPQDISNSSSKLKKKIRDIERLLSKKRETMPSNILVEKERQLKALTLELNNVGVKQKIKKLAKKYHMVRFFERKKAVRKYKQAKKDLEDALKSGSGVKAAKKELKQRSIDVIYVYKFPKTEKYMALYASGDASDENAKKGMEKTKKMVEAKREEYTAQLGDVVIEDLIEGKYKTEDFYNYDEEVDAAEEAEDEEDDFFE